MMNSNQYISQDYLESNEKLIMNPFELFLHEISTKDIATKKTSIQTVHIIALTMRQKEITDQLLPFLVKMLVEQSSKDIKVAIVKSFKNILPLLRKQYSYLNLIQILIDIVLVFNEIEIKNQTLSTLGALLFEENVLSFQIFKQPLKSLITQELFQIAQPANGKSAKQLTFYLIKYFFCNQQKLNKEEISDLIKFLKQNFLYSAQNDYFNLKLLAQNFHIFVQVWPQMFTQEIYIFINFFLDKTETQENVEDKVQKSEQVEKTKTTIPQQILTQLKINMVQTLINLVKNVNHKQVFPYIQSLLKEEDSKVKISLIKKTKQIFQTFHNENLQPLLVIYRTFADQPQDIKKAILEVIEEIPLQEDEKKQSIFKVCKNTVDLKNIFIQALIRNNKTQSVSEILNESDYDFKIKIFTKLPDSLLHRNALYAQIIDSLLSEPKKNFRSKLNIILNIISRIEQKTKSSKDFSSQFDISYLLVTLLKYFGDKIAIIRVNVAKLFALILYHYNVAFQTFKRGLSDNFYGDNKSWIEKQTVLIMIKEYLTIKKEKYTAQNDLKNSNFNIIQVISDQQFYKFILQLLKDSIQGYKIKDQSRVTTIANLSNLAQEVCQSFSIQV